MKSLVFCVMFLFSFSISNEKLEEYYLNKGIFYLYNYEFNQSINYLDSVIFINPNHPVPYFVKIANKWLSTQINDGYEASYEIIYSKIEETIPVYEKLITDNPQIAKNYLYLGSTHGLQARVDLAKNNWFNIILSSYKGYNNIKIAKELNPDLFDIYMPIGLIEYLTSILPKPAQWAASLIGVIPNRELGLYHLNIAYEKSKYSWIESGNILIYAYLYFENNLELAKNISENLYIKFPNHPYYLYLYAESLIRLNEIDNFENTIIEMENKVYNYPEIQQNECEIKFNYLMALYFYQKKEFNKSIIHCNWILQNYKMEMDWLLGYNYLLLGKINDLQGNRSQALKFYNKILELNNLFIYDEWAIKYIKNPFSDTNKDPLFKYD